MVDCSVTVNFINELHRMCRTTECFNCPVDRAGYRCSAEDVTPTVVGIVQRWSDKNPEFPVKTLADYYFECFPNAPKKTDGLPDICPHDVGFTDSGCITGCAFCWGVPYEVENE